MFVARRCPFILLLALLALDLARAQVSGGTSGVSWGNCGQNCLACRYHTVGTGIAPAWTVRCVHIVIHRGHMVTAIFVLNEGPEWSTLFDHNRFCLCTTHAFASGYLVCVLVGPGRHDVHSVHARILFGNTEWPDRCVCPMRPILQDLRFGHVLQCLCRQLCVVWWQMLAYALTTCCVCAVVLFT